MSMANPEATAPQIEVQYDQPEDEGEPPSSLQVRQALAAALPANAQVTVRFISRTESRKLNLRHRGRNRPTNVLAFPDPGMPHVVGDIAICPALVAQEAIQCNVPTWARYAHLLIHAALHLQGMDHDTQSKATQMERTEAKLLATLGLPDPYEEEQ